MNSDAESMSLWVTDAELIRRIGVRRKSEMVLLRPDEIAILVQKAADDLTGYLKNGPSAARAEHYDAVHIEGVENRFERFSSLVKWWLDVRRTP